MMRYYRSGIRLAKLFKSYDRSCINCGRGINAPYIRCYRCHQGRKRANWHDPESLPELAARDAARGRSEYFVYVLDTKYGHYVGHTGNIRARLRAHAVGKVPSTARGEPRLIWRSAPLPTRARATRFEAALKSWRDNERAEFRNTTGFDASPFNKPAFTHHAEQRSQLGGVGVLVLIVGLAIAAVTLAVLLGGNN